MKLWKLILLFVILWLGLPFLVSIIFRDIEEWSKIYGPFGDSFETVNALFSGLALAGVIYAILLQRQDLEIQSKELKLSRREFHLNRISNIIYQQIKLIKSAVDAISFNHPLNERREVTAYQGLFILKNIVEDAMKNHKFKLIDGGQQRDIVLDATIWDEAGPDILRLINILINSVEIIEEIVHDNESDVSDQEKDERNSDRKKLLVLFERNIGDEIKVLLNRIWVYSDITSAKTDNNYHREMANRLRSKLQEFKKSNLLDDSRLTNDNFYLIKV